MSGTSVALVGSACRLPSASGLDAFWRVLADGRSVVSKIDEDRFGTRQYLHPDRSRPGRSVTFAAGQIDRPYDFDPGYFGISPREAAAMDPQQRVLLEVAVEALENAGIPADRLAGRPVGVYVGASSLDYSNQAQLDPASIEPQSMTGNTLSIIANRLSYVFDLTGPSYTVDTACSSSLIALHNAMEDIRAGRIDTAIVGGVSLLLNPVPFIGFSRASMLSANGACRAFDAAADGYVRSEGAVALVLRAESAARAAREPIRARLVASGINADGRTAGLSLPAARAQAQLLHTVYEAAELDPARLAFVEAHGTGTRVGDPAETEALGTVLGARRRARLLIGSSKTNFGHLEPASGLVGVLKAQLALANDLFPASLHFKTPNPDIDFAGLNLAVATEPTPLARDGTVRLAGVNSFGFGGANAHVVLADGEPSTAVAEPAGEGPLVLTAASVAALSALAAATAERLDGADDAAVRRHVNAAAHRRSRLAHRAVVEVAEGSAMAAALRSAGGGAPAPSVSVGEAVGPAQAPVFVYCGNGSQWAGMGRAAYQGDADFRRAFDRTDRHFMSCAGWSLVSMLFSADLETEIERTEIAQPLLFAIQVALTEALARRGVRPAAVIGHSVGEVAAAWACGALPLAEAARVIHARSTQQEVTRHLGGMAALLAPLEEAQRAIASHAGLEVAAVNSSRAVTISGPQDALAAFAREAREARLVVKRLDLDYPFHCALVEPIREPLLAALGGIAPGPATIPMISTVTGEPIDGDRLGADYWWQNVRRPVAFQAAALRALADGHRLFVEVGPRPVLTNHLADAARLAETRAAALPSLRQGESGVDPVGAVVRRIMAHGGAVDEAALFGAPVAPPDVLPPYPWQHATYRTAFSDESVRLLKHREHPLLGERLRLDVAEWRAVLDAEGLPFLADHVVGGAVLFPAAGFAELLLAAGRLLAPGVALELRGLDIVAPLVLDDGEREVRTREFAPAAFVVESRRRLSGEGWTLHAKGDVGVAPSPPSAALDVAAEAGGERRTVEADEIYERTARFGLDYGPAFRRAERVELYGEAHARVHLTAGDRTMGFVLDPTLFDASFHALFAFFDEGGEGETMLPIRIDRLRVAADAGPPVSAELHVEHHGERIVEAHYNFTDAEGALVARATGVRFQRVALARGPDIIRAVPRLVRLARAGEPAAGLAARLPAEAVGDVEPSDAALTVEAGVLSAAAKALAAAFAEPATLGGLIAAGRVSSGAAPLVARLLPALAAAGIAREEDGRYSLVADPIPLADIVTLLVEERPERLAEATILAALPGALTAALARGPSERPWSEGLLSHLACDAPFVAPANEALCGWLQPILREDAARRVCVVGAGNVGLLRRLAMSANPYTVQLVITDRDEARLERARLVFERRPGVAFATFGDLGEGPRCDVLMVAAELGPTPLDGLAGLLRPGGILIGAALRPSLFADVVGGLTASWWSDTSGRGVGPLRTAPEWAAALATTGWQEASAEVLACGETDAVLFVARRKGSAEPCAPASHALSAVGPMARRTLGALSAMADPAPVVGDLSVVPEGACVLAVDVPDAAGLAGSLADLGRFLTALGPEPRHVTLVTFGAHGGDGARIVPAAAAVAAYGRVAMNELPHLDVRLVDVAATFDASEAAVRLNAELAEPNGEREVVLSSDHRSVVRYVPNEPALPGDALALAVPRQGSIDHLAWEGRPHPELPADAVRVRVAATGLNFRDVMWTLGLLPHEALEDGYAGATLGMECAGTVECVGDGVTDLAPGDPVLAFAPAAFASHVTVRADAVVRRPDGLSAEAAATMPVAFLTAYYALVELARLEEGETVLVHGGAGGVGLAALQVARWRGARVFATAGSPEKRALLEALGAERVFSSRDLTFADEALGATGGTGVDVVLNSLAGEAMVRSLDALRPFGRFCELGKRDFYEDTRLGLRPFRRNLSYFGIDADQLLRHRPALARRLLADIVGMVEAGDLAPLPYRVFAADGVKDAFRLMQSAQHVGKIVVTAPSPPSAATARPPIVDPKKAYLLVGGTSGFGFATARWLAARGARHLVLASRSGVGGDEVARAIDAMRADGVAVEVAVLDVTDAATVRGLVEKITAERPLGGVWHMAMVLDDALLGALDAARHEAVLAPKVLGAAALEAATADVALDHFVLYSSLTVAFGNPGQANYVAANAALEAVARRRRAEGRPALAVAWGAISDVGVLSRGGAAGELLGRKLGRSAMTSSEALAILGQLIAEGAMTEGSAVRMVGRVDWAAARRELAIAASPAFEAVADAVDVERDVADGRALSARLAGLEPAEATREVIRLLSVEISHILKLPASEVDPHKPLTALGMDSLMGVELRMSAEERLGVDIPLMSLTAGATLADIARRVVERAGKTSDGDASTDALIARHVGASPAEGSREAVEAVLSRTAGVRTILS
ncbi:type I polyketide synthase [Acuticoccus sp.]|uniref:type I polyketide synthase n=1 Tax=Acuticoccus sp. TaxID=1904378 RepID=UPI003B5269B4